MKEEEKRREKEQVSRATGEGGDEFHSRVHVLLHLVCLCLSSGQVRPPCPMKRKNID